MSYKFPLATSSWSEAEYSAIQRVIKSDIFSMSDNVKQFEQQFAEYMGSRFSVMVNSGSSANLLMIASLFYVSDKTERLQRGDEVIVPAVSWSTTYFPLYQYGLKIKFVDIDCKTLNYDLNKLNQAISDKTRVVLAVNLLGNPNDFNRIAEMINGRDILLLEDNCESMGAKFDNQMTGTFGLMGTFSSFFSHHISTMEGGVIITDEEEIYHILLSLRAHGWTRNLPKQNHVCGEKSSDPFEESFRFVLPGYNVRPLEMSGALGIEQLKKLDNIVKERRKNAALIKEACQDNDHVCLQEEQGESSWFGFSIILKPESAWTRLYLLEKLNENGFECRPIVTGNFAKNEVVKKYFDYEVSGSLSNADYIDKNGLMVGNHHYPMNEASEVLSKLLHSV